jgi:di/tricarboxylate transporter
MYFKWLLAWRRLSLSGEGDILPLPIQVLGDIGQMWNYEVIVTVAVTVMVFIGFIRERQPVDITALLGVAVLLIAGVLSTTDMMAVFTNSAPLTIAAMFIISAALERTGVIARLGDLVIRMAGRSWLQAACVIIFPVMGMSAFMNNTPVVVILTPVVMSVARAIKVPASKLLIILSFASILGGTTTLLGTSTNILVDGVAGQYGMERFGIFEITPVGLAMAAVGALYMLTVGRWLLPERVSHQEMVGDKPVKHFLADLVVPPDSPFIGMKLSEMRITAQAGTRLVDLVRDGYSLASSMSKARLQEGDRVILETEMENLIDLRKSGELSFTETELATVSSSESQIIEAIVGPEAKIIGRTVSDLDLQQRFNVYVLAVHRHKKKLTRNFEHLRLQVGDTLLLEGKAASLKKLYQSRQFVNISVPHPRPYLREKAPIAVLAILGVMLLAALNVMPIVALAIIAATVVVATGCLKAEEAYDSIQWPLLVLIYAMLAIADTLAETGAVSLLAAQMGEALGPYSPLIALSLIYLLTNAVTEIMSNNAAAIMLTPVAIGVAQSMGVDPRPFVVAVMLAGSCSFATPIGYQTNTFVYQAGGYRFTDFCKVGLPLNLLLWLTATFMIPQIWPLVPVEAAVESAPVGWH